MKVMILLKKSLISDFPSHFIIPKFRDDKMRIFTTESVIKRRKV